VVLKKDLIFQRIASLSSDSALGFLGERECLGNRTKIRQAMPREAAELPEEKSVLFWRVALRRKRGMFEVFRWQWRSIALQVMRYLISR
jgi:hypothetical protein